MSRESRRADELVIGDHIFNTVVRRIVGAHTVGERTTLMDAEGESWRVVSATTYLLATAEEIAEALAERDRERVAERFTYLGQLIRTRKLPVPHDLRDVSVHIELPDDVDLSGWAGVLKAPVKKDRGRLLPSIESDELGVGVQLFGGNTGEFGPDVEHTDAVGAFPVVAGQAACARCGAIGRDLNPVELCSDCEIDLAFTAVEEMRAQEEEPRRGGWAPPSGHAINDETAMQHDRYGNGRAEE